MNCKNEPNTDRYGPHKRSIQQSWTNQSLLPSFVSFIQVTEDHHCSGSYNSKSALCQYSCIHRSSRLWAWQKAKLWKFLMWFSIISKKCILILPEGELEERKNMKQQTDSFNLMMGQQNFDANNHFLQWFLSKTETWHECFG